MNHAVARSFEHTPSLQRMIRSKRVGESQMDKRALNLNLPNLLPGLICQFLPSYDATQHTTDHETHSLSSRNYSSEQLGRSRFLLEFVHPDELRTNR